MPACACFTCYSSSSPPSPVGTAGWEPVPATLFSESNALNAFIATFGAVPAGREVRGGRRKIFVEGINVHAVPRLREPIDGVDAQAKRPGLGPRAQREICSTLEQSRNTSLSPGLPAAGPHSSEFFVVGRLNDIADSAHYRGLYLPERGVERVFCLQ